jgi:hypothetical protein
MPSEPRGQLVIVGGWFVPRSPKSVVAVLNLPSSEGLLSIDDETVTLAPRYGSPRTVPGPNGPIAIPVVMPLGTIERVEVTGRFFGNATFRCQDRAVDGVQFWSRRSTFKPLLARLRALEIQVVAGRHWS